MLVRDSEVDLQKTTSSILDDQEGQGIRMIKESKREHVQDDLSVSQHF